LNFGGLERSNLSRNFYMLWCVQKDCLGGAGMSKITAMLGVALALLFFSEARAEEKEPLAVIARGSVSDW